MNTTMRTVIATTPLRMNMMTTHNHGNIEQCTDCHLSTWGIIIFLVLLCLTVGACVYFLMKE